MSISVKNKEIRIKNPLMVIEDENRAEVVEFVIDSASAIQGASGMAFYVQYRNSLGEIGMDSVSNVTTTDDTNSDTLVLDWLPSATFSKEKGIVEIQIVGFTQSLEPSEDETYQSGKLYFTEDGDFIAVYPADSEHSPKVGDAITDTVYENQVTANDHRWSTAKATLMLPENVVEGGTPVYTEEQVQSLITQLNAEVLLAKGYSESAASSASTATTKANLAADWAEKEAAVTTGHYSAKHWAEVATTAGSGIEAQALKAEGYAVGEQNGTPVSSGSDYYENNAKYYSQQASSSATSAGTSAGNAGSSADTASAKALVAEGYASGTQNGSSVSSGSPYYHNNASYYATQAGSAKSGADASALVSEGYAVGTQNGTAVQSGTYYHNNSAYYASQASASATTAGNNASLAADWAESDDVIGEDGHSAKYWAGETEREVADIVKHDDESALISATTPINADQLNGHADTYFAPTGEAGATVDLALDTSNYHVTVSLKNKAGEVISSSTIDLPNEVAIVGISYNPLTKKMTFTYQSGDATDVDISSLVDNLVTSTQFSDHTGNTDIHVSASEKTDWNSHMANTTVHITSGEREGWNDHVNDSDIHVTSAEHDEYNTHMDDDSIHVTSGDKSFWNGHVADTDIHVTTSDKAEWDAKYDLPQGGIPKTDLANTVQTSLSYADNSITYDNTVSA